MRLVLHLKYICLPAGITATRRSSAAKDPKSVFILPALVGPIAIAVYKQRVKHIH